MKKETGSLEQISRKHGEVYCEYNVIEFLPLYRVEYNEFFEGNIIYHDYNTIGNDY